MNVKTVLFFLGSLLLASQVNSQNIEIEASDKSLNEVLIGIRDRFDVSFSFDDSMLSGYRVTVSKQFSTTAEALEFLLKGLPLSFFENEGVFIIYPDYSKNLSKRTNDKTFFLSGKIVEQRTLEGLPFTNILINEYGVAADEYGGFAHKSKVDSIFHIKVSHLGYYILDTTIRAGINHRIELIPSMNKLNEITVSDHLLETFLYEGNEAAVLKLNHKITRFLPGSSDNSVFNLLRLQSGILASSEQSNELMIWGSYEGQSRILFDDFMLFGLKNFNDNISAVNPFMVKNIKVMKAGFNASYGKCVGGIAEITGKNGIKNKPSIIASINNYTINSLFELPVTSKSALLIAFRHTYYDLYDNMEVDFFKNNENKESLVSIIPDYVFRDLNLKYTTQGDNGMNLRFSLLTGQDIFSYDIQEDINLLEIQKETSEENLQKGASIVLNKVWNKGVKTNFVVCYSSLNTTYKDQLKITRSLTGLITRDDSLEMNNTTSEWEYKIDNTFAINDQNAIETGISYTSIHTSWVEDTSGIQSINQRISGGHLTFFAQDKIALKNTNINIGIRSNYLPYLNRFFHEPRISVSQKIGSVVSLKAACGLYNQFMVKASVEDEYENYRYMWTLADEKNYPVMDGLHITGGLYLNLKNTNISVEPYAKHSEGLTRYIFADDYHLETIYQGLSRSYGIDLYLKHNFNGHVGWVSYTLSKTEEQFDTRRPEKWVLAAHDQRHEIKIAGIINVDPVYISGNYVYGSGFPVPRINNEASNEAKTIYSRLDVAITYKFSKKRFFGEVGASVLNVLDHNNMLYNNTERLPANQTATIDLYSESVPFTPSIYLKIGF